MSKEIKWHPADGLISRWGAGIVVADVEIDKNHTLSIFCDADQKQKVELMFGNREWVGLTDDEIEQGCKESWVTLQAWQAAVWWAEEKLKEKNT